MKTKDLSPVLIDSLNYRTKKYNILVEEPHIQSRSSYILLVQELALTKHVEWLEYREEYLDQYEVLTCVKCGITELKKKIEDKRDKEQLKYLATVDHIKPLSKGGEKFNYDNMQVMCHECNNKKGDKWGEKNV